MKVDVIESVREDLTTHLSDNVTFESLPNISENEKIAEESSESLGESHFDATRIYLNELGKSKLLTADQEKTYGSRALNGDEEARENHD